MVGDHFYAGDKNYDPREIPSDKEVKSAEDLKVDLPADNTDFHKLAEVLAGKLPRSPELPAARSAALAWQTAQRKKLTSILRAKVYQVKAVKKGGEDKDGLKVTFWQLQMDNTWTVPVVELVRGVPKTTTLLINDAGRTADSVNAARLLEAGHRVLAVDPFYFGESKIPQRDWLFALLVATVGDRSLGIQASQLAAIARWSGAEHKTGPVHITATGPRTSVMALAAAGLESRAIGRLEAEGSLGSLKEIIEQNRSVEQTPELFCFGLLEAFDIKQMTALAAPRAVAFLKAGKRVRTELARLKDWYAVFGSDFDPLP
jgi:hypothetical protein